MTNVNNHGILASNAKEVQNCKPGFILQRKINELKNDLAASGRSAHELAELFLRVNVGTDNREALQPVYDAIRAEGLHYSRQFESNVMHYVNHCLAVYDRTKEADSDTLVLIEEPVRYGGWLNNTSGIVDFAVVGNGVLEVIDYKSGNGIEAAKHNPQLVLYALALMAQYYEVKGIRTVRLSIVKPECSRPVDRVEYSPEELYYRGIELKDVFNSLDLRTGENDQHCKKCGLRGACRHAAVYQLREMGYIVNDDAILRDPEVVGATLNTIKEYDAWSRDFRTHWKDEMIERGVRVPGYKIVEGNRCRDYTDHERAVRTLMSVYGEDFIKYVTPIPPADLESKIGESEFKRIITDNGLHVDDKYGPRLVADDAKGVEIISERSLNESFGPIGVKNT